MGLNLRAVGGNVLLKKVAADVHRSGLVVYGGKSTTVLQLGEVVGLGGRWTQDRPWFPPIPNPHRTPLVEVVNGVMQERWDDNWKPSWKTPDSRTVRPKPAQFNEGHRAWLEEIKVGDLVVYIQSRVYEFFEWEGEDILVYPGNWIMGVAGDLTITEEELRRYERDQFDDAPHEKPTVNRARGPNPRATGESIRKFFERRGMR